MQFFKLTTLVAAMMSAAAVTQAADWSAPATHECALRTWSAIKMDVDKQLLPVWGVLPPPIKMALEQANVLNADHSLIVNPSFAQMELLANILPPGIFLPYADIIVDKCLAGPPTSSSSSSHVNPTSSSSSTQPSSSSSSSSIQSSSSSASSSAQPSSSSSTSSAQPSSSSSSTDSQSTPSSTPYVTSSSPCTTSTTPAVPSSTPIKCIPRPHY
ncbi:hypothetical protein GGF42_000975 [Coemansia sp. RSA 2424]|nr:hypothetical protein GGF42_000975 [Coemansia sp. RSA 2424]